MVQLRKMFTEFPGRIIQTPRNETHGWGRLFLTCQDRFQALLNIVNIQRNAVAAISGWIGNVGQRLDFQLVQIKCPGLRSEHAIKRNSTTIAQAHKGFHLRYLLALLPGNESAARKLELRGQNPHTAVCGLLSIGFNQVRDVSLVRRNDQVWVVSNQLPNRICHPILPVPLFRRPGNIGWNKSNAKPPGTFRTIARMEMRGKNR